MRANHGCNSWKSRAGGGCCAQPVVIWKQRNEEAEQNQKAVRLALHPQLRGSVHRHPLAGSFSRVGHGCYQTHVPFLFCFASTHAFHVCPKRPSRKLTWNQNTNPRARKMSSQHSHSGALYQLAWLFWNKTLVTGLLSTNADITLTSYDGTLVAIKYLHVSCWKFILANGLYSGADLAQDFQEAPAPCSWCGTMLRKGQAGELLFANAVRG